LPAPPPSVDKCRLHRPTNRHFHFPTYTLQ
jgi:hypothetical protein